MILNVHKPCGITSHDVVDHIRKMTGEKRVGHAGTLDPFASGVLIIGVGRESTKQLGKLTIATDKEYEAELSLGKTSTTGDPEGVIIDHHAREIKEDEIEKILELFRGEIEQRPHRFSAIKVNGTRAYALARQGKKVELPLRKVTIYALELLHFAYPTMTIRVVCSSGTYIRSLAEDIGTKLETGAYLTKLTRTRIGRYRLEESLPLDSISNKTLSPI